MRKWVTTMTREETIKLLTAELRDRSECYYSYLQHYGHKDKAEENYLDALHMTLSALREQPRWISVTERLPEIYKTVLVYRENLSVSGGYMSLEFLTTDFGHATQWSNDLQTWKSKVTHWMPLPEPPTEEEV